MKISGPLRDGVAGCNMLYVSRCTYELDLHLNAECVSCPKSSTSHWVVWRGGRAQVHGCAGVDLYCTAPARHDMLYFDPRTNQILARVIVLPYAYPSTSLAPHR